MTGAVFAEGVALHSGSIKTLLLVHGYSVRTLNSWGRLPQLLQASGLAPTSIFLSDFVTLDDRYHATI